jgi:predicted GNAT family acetyltransferase
MDTTIDYPLMHNEALERFEFEIDGLVPFIQYTRANDNLLVIEHTEVPMPLEGKGIGSKLVEKTLQYIEQHGWKIVPLCPFTSMYIRQHMEWDRIVHHIL